MFTKQALIPVLWTLVIGVLCGLPGNTFPDLSLWALLQFDSFAHATVFVIFVFLWSVAFSKQKNNFFLRENGAWLAVMAGIAYGCLIEILQFFIFVRRSAEWTDMLSDAIGCMIGYFVFRAIYRPVLNQRA